MRKITIKLFKEAEKGLFGNISAIAKKLGISRSYISRIESRVLLKLKNYLIENDIDL